MQYAGEKRDQEALNRVNSYGLGTVDVGLRTQPRTQKGTNHKKRLYVWKLNTPGRIRTCDSRFRKAVLYPLSYEGV